MTNNWYLGVTSEQVAEDALLVGDAGRIDRIVARLESPREVSQERGLRTVTGRFEGRPVTAAAFGMGAPIAALVIHELRGAGVRRFLRLGTALTWEKDHLGRFLVAEGAVRGESTSASYVPDGYPAAADYSIQSALRGELERAGVCWQAGLLASYDGFYTDILAAADGARGHLPERLEELRRGGVVGLDMETSAVLAVARALGARAGCLCLATVAWEGPSRMATAAREAEEDRLVDLGLRSLALVGGRVV